MNFVQKWLNLDARSVHAWLKDLIHQHLWMCCLQVNFQTSCLALIMHTFKAVIYSSLSYHGKMMIPLAYQWKTLNFYRLKLQHLKGSGCCLPRLRSFKPGSYNYMNTVIGCDWFFSCFVYFVYSLYYFISVAVFSG